MIRKLLTKLGFNHFADTPGASSPKMLADFERTIGRPLPADYREFVMKYAPGLFRKRVRFRPLEPNPWVVDGLKGMDGFFGLNEAWPSQLLQEYEGSKYDIPENFFPIGWDSGANHILMAFDDPVGRIYFHDRDSDKVFLCANSFTEFLESFEPIPDEKV